MTIFKKILNIFFIIFFILLIFHFLGYGKIIINKLTGLTSFSTTANKKDYKQTIQYIEKLKEFDKKMFNTLNYYIINQNDLCYSEIKIRNKNIENKKYNINYFSLIGGDLRKIISCNIYNSLVSDIYIEIPQNYNTFNKIVLNFIESYIKKGYDIHLIYNINNNFHGNILKEGISSITLIYNLGTDEDIKNVYNYFKLLKKYHNFNFGIDFKYKNIEDYKEVKIGKIEEWYKIQNNNNIIINIKDDFFKSFGNKKVDFTEELFNYIKEHIELFKLFNSEGNLSFNINIQKKYVDVIDWYIIKQVLNYKNISLILPNSILLFKGPTYDEQAKKLIKEYEGILSKKDILLLYYKYRSYYLESKIKK